MKNYKKETIQSLVEGASYNLSALKVEGWVAKGKLNYTGKITSDLTIDFYYEKMEMQNLRRNYRV